MLSMLFFYCFVPVATLLLAVFALRRSNSLSPRARILYLLTLFLEIPGAITRFAFGVILSAILFIPLWLAFGMIALIAGVVTFFRYSTFTVGFTVAGTALVTAGVIITIAAAFLIAWGPIIWSILSLLGLHGGHRWTRWAMSARKLSATRELASYNRCLTHIQSLSPKPLRAPSHTYAIKSYELRAWCVGSTLYLTSALLKSNHLMAALAHELFMVNSAEGRLVLALRRFVMPAMYALSRWARTLAPGNFTAAFLQTGQGRPAGLILYVISGLLALSGGGLGILLTAWLWLCHWRKTVYAADQFVASLGLSGPLISYLEDHEYLDVATPFFFNPIPDSELRIDALMQYQNHQVPGTPAGHSTQPLISQRQP